MYFEPGSLPFNLQKGGELVAVIAQISNVSQYSGDF